MAKHRALASELFAVSLGRASASAIWRSVVVAGAMLGTPLTGCAGKSPPPASAKTDPAADQAAKDKAAPDKAQADKDKAASDQAAADKAAADKAAADKEAADKEAADKAAADEAAKRVRGRGERPSGRGFILA